MLSVRKNQSISYEQQAKFIQDRILLTEKHLGDFCNVIAEYTRKAGRMRDKADELAKIAMNYAEIEEVNQTLQNALVNFSYCFTTLGNYGDLRVQRIETKVLPDLSQYNLICKNAKEDVKQIFFVRDREIARKRQLDRIRDRNPRNRQQITQAESELLKASAEVSRTIHELEEQTNDFEKRKLHDIKNVMLEFITTEMAYHAKALEVFSKAYQFVDTIDENQDLQDFQNIRGSLDMDLRKVIKRRETQFPDKGTNYKLSKSLNSLNTSNLKLNKRQNDEIKRPSSLKFRSKSSESIESVNIDHIPSVDSITGSDSEISATSEIANKFMARKHKNQRK